MAPSADDIEYSGTIKQFDGTDGFIASEDITSSVSFCTWELPEDLCKARTVIDNEKIQFSIRLTANAKPHAAKMVFNKALTSQAAMQVANSPMEPRPTGPQTGTVRNYKKQFGYGFIDTPCFPRPVHFQRQGLLGIDESSIAEGVRLKFMISYSMNESKPLASMVQLATESGGPADSHLTAHSKAPGPAMPDGSAPKAGSPAVPTDNADWGQRFAGTVKNFFPDRRYGFVLPDGEVEELYFSQYELQAVGCSIDRGARVEFEIRFNKEGKKVAKSISFMDPPAGGGGTAKTPLPPGQIARAGVPVRSGSNLTKGTIRFFNDAKGYGFISVPGVSNNIYFGVTDINGAPPKEMKDQKVLFELHKGSDGKPIAKAVSIDGAFGGPRDEIAENCGKRFCGNVKHIDIEGNGLIQCEIISREISFQRAELPFQAVDQWGNISLQPGRQVLFTLQAAEELGGSPTAVNVQIAPSMTDIIYRGTVRWYDDLMDEGSIYCDDMSSCVRFSGWEVPEVLRRWTLDGALVRFSIRFSPDAKPMAAMIEWNFESLALQQVPSKPNGIKPTAGQYYNGKVSRWNSSFKYGHIAGDGFETEVYFSQLEAPDGLASLGEITMGQEVRFKLAYGENGKPCGQMVHSAKLRDVGMDTPDAKRQRTNDTTSIMHEVMPADGVSDGAWAPADGISAPIPY
eukprot:gnl/MRDRNA2_/MRDRNA2_125415_c0_seq1.p1 gnl/MRDRNA2_/MRDRNA2_125415_c0~~gnl/MRDRNA2_/MRDRNA2_125415_c0_seq1.p1  ORF type:complete len:764 (+),score=127.76 gnl/MRDRNA2_/MRDRNA2_125415_c0_seq1:244-2292(+)